MLSSFHKNFCQKGKEKFKMFLGQSADSEQQCYAAGEPPSAAIAADGGKIISNMRNGDERKKDERQKTFLAIGVYKLKWKPD